jgi:hypothetical protein
MFSIDYISPFTCDIDRKRKNWTFYEIIKINNC